MNWLKKQIIERFLKGYLSGYLKRLQGYKMLTGIILLILQVTASILGDPSGYLNVLISTLYESTVPLINPSEISIIASSLLALWGLAMKVFKAVEGKPQVPTIIIDKEVLRKAPDLKAQLDIITKS